MWCSSLLGSLSPRSGNLNLSLVLPSSNYSLIRVTLNTESDTIFLLPNPTAAHLQVWTNFDVTIVNTRSMQRLLHRPSSGGLFLFFYFVPPTKTVLEKYIQAPAFESYVFLQTDSQYDFHIGPTGSIFCPYLISATIWWTRLRVTQDLPIVTDRRNFSSYHFSIFVSRHAFAKKSRLHYQCNSLSIPLTLFTLTTSSDSHSNVT